MDRLWWRLIAGLLLIAVGIILLLAQLEMISLTGPLWGGVVLLAGSSVFLALWLGNPSEWWPLIPGGIMAGWGAGTLCGALGLASWVVTLLGFGGTVAPFLYILFRLGASEAWWALIPAGVIGAWGAGAVLSDVGLHEAVVPLVGFVGSAVPFLLIFAMDRQKNWWALIPAAVMGLMGVVVTLGEVVGEEWTATFIMLGIALAFFVVSAINRSNRWALIPAVVLTIVGVGVGPLASALHLIWPLLVIALGAFFLLRALASKPRG